MFCNSPREKYYKEVSKKAAGKEAQARQKGDRQTDRQLQDRNTETRYETAAQIRELTEAENPETSRQKKIKVYVIKTQSFHNRAHESQ